MIKHFAHCVAFVLGIMPTSLFAGNITGVIRELKSPDGLPNVTVSVINIGSNDTVTQVQSKADGSFNVPLPDGLGVTVQFQDGIHTPAALIGISGSVKLAGFDIFMPGLMQKATPPCQCYTYCWRGCRCR
jgi:hypothetical protein